jgi:hypothetical protein
MALLQPPSFMQNRTDHTAQEDRLWLQSLLAGHNVGGVGGTAAAAGLAVVRARTVADMNIIVTRERFFIPGTESPDQGVYHTYLTADQVVPIATSSPTLPRKDIIVANVRDAFYSGSSNDWQLQAIAGTPNSSPIQPATPANGIVIAVVTVPANATSIGTSNISNVAPVVSAAGGSPVFSTAAARDSFITAPYEGMSCYTTIDNTQWIFDGTNWIDMSSTGKVLGETDALPFTGGGFGGLGSSGNNTIFPMAAVTITLTSARKIDVTVSCDLYVPTGANAMIAWLRVGWVTGNSVPAAVLGGNTNPPTAGVGNGVHAEVQPTATEPSTGIGEYSHTITLSAGTYTVYGIIQRITGGAANNNDHYTNCHTKVVDRGPA